MAARHIYILNQYQRIDRRTLLQASSLQEAGYRVTILAQAATDAAHALNLPAGPTPEQMEGIIVERIKVEGRDPRYRWLYRLGRLGLARGSHYAEVLARGLALLAGRNAFSRIAPRYAARAKADLYLVRDTNGLPAGIAAARASGAKLICDAHELFSELPNRYVRLRRGYWRKMDRQLLPHCDAISTVNEFIAEEISRRSGVKLPTVIYNATNPPLGFDPEHPADLLRDDLDIAKDKRIVLYQGWVDRGRSVENLVMAAKYLPEDIVVVIMGGGNMRAELQKLAADEGLAHKVYFREAVPQSRMVEYCASADVGLIPYRALSLNLYYASPNKLFDFITAGLPIIANDLPFLRKMVLTEGLGMISDLDSPAGIAHAAIILLNDPQRLAEMRANLRRAAEVYNWAHEAKKLVAMYAEVFAATQ